MKKFLSAIIIFTLCFMFFPVDKARAKSNKTKEQLVLGKGVIGRVCVSDSVDAKTNSPLNVKKSYSPETKTFYTTIELIDAKPNTSVYIRWFYNGGKKKTLVDKISIKAKGSKNLLFALEKPKNKNWYKGDYEAEIIINRKFNVEYHYQVQ